MASGPLGRGSLSRKSSAPWDRLRPVKQDPLESMGFVSKGDHRLLDLKTQESFYNKIVARYMQFCTNYSKDLDAAFASLSLEGGLSTLLHSAANPLVRSCPKPSLTTTLDPQPAMAGQQSGSLAPPPSSELSIILVALRKLREGLLASSSTAPSPVFSQRVHVFNIRVAVLARHPPSYHPSLLHLLFVLHTPSNPLPRSELVEMTTYLILDMATRQSDLCNAYALRYNSRIKFGYENLNTDKLLRSIVTGDWISFWRVRRKVDGYIRSILFWHLEPQRRLSLKAIGRSYLTSDIKWILESATGGEMGWEELVRSEDVGWLREGEKAVIRKPKAR
ncbi:uncharacterized protein A1O9_09013 [Exophiala aquamarina CBS 119918]|uniref:CSN8/PSMD8/EIF3K domain-containing protein n=1 Tax=Exophiala aquamarina CBS 119918 TaxID=1182545 RepID=A0A072P3Y1_9EURO|nr:uncharacterized protein A1O9_09013 [Exophiala aquamarina CBS 119918]KEF54571.1 hypothetical protein A1O9_09013 [Exophiala aquamarina CBS 119918]